MSIGLDHWSIIIPIENINKCRSLGGFEKFIESQKDRIGHDVWYDEYLYRYRVPDDDDREIFDFWEKEGLQLHNKIAGDSEISEWKDLCIADENGPSLKCDWLEFDKDVPCVWLKGKPKGELHGSNRKYAKVISESTIEKEYYVEFFERLYNFQKVISIIPKLLFKAFRFRYSVAQLDPIKWRPPISFLNYLINPIFYIIQLIFLLVASLMVKVLPKFDANKYLEIFDLIILDKGYILDYRYCGDCPVVYTRNKLFLLHVFNRVRKNIRDILGPFISENIRDVSFERSPKGFFQFAVFSRVVGQFYLYWHACENDLVFIHSKSQIEDILKRILQKEHEGAIRDNDINNLIWDWEVRRKMAEDELYALFQNRKSDDDFSIFLGPPREGHGHRDIETGKITPGYWTSREELEALFNASLDPQVTIMENGYGIVRILTFSKWGGFEYCRYAIQWPISVEEIYEEQETVLSYSCGIQF